jgi:hypothetical protein
MFRAFDRAGGRDAGGPALAEVAAIAARRGVRFV